MFGLTWTLILLMSQLGWSWTRQTRLRHSYVNGFWIHNRINPEFVFPDQLPRLKKQVRGFNPSALRPSSTQVPPFMIASSSDNHPLYSSLPMPPSAPTDEIFVPVESCPGLEEEDGYCERPRDYPDIRLIKSLVKNKTNIFGKIFDTLETPETRQDLGVPLGMGLGEGRLRPNRPPIVSNQEDETTDGVDLGPRTDDDPNQDVDFIQESPICDSRESFVYPRTARNLDKKWRFVINVPREETGEDEEYVQAVKVERCLRPGGACNIDSVTGSQTVCRQKYTLRRLLALSDNGQQYIDTFKFPSCCVCYEKRNFGLDHWGLLKRNLPAVVESKKRSRKRKYGRQENMIHSYTPGKQLDKDVPPS